MRVVLASGNPNKLRELGASLPGWTLEPLGTHCSEEEGSTYEENARAKARFARGLVSPHAWTLGEDSGLEVDGLGGRPGVLSARYPGPGEDPVAKLLAELEGVSGGGRRARYVCELVLVSPEGDERRGTGVLEGSIAREARGTEGFGYDPVFVPAGEAHAVAELGNEWKRAHSHRARAAAALLKAVATL